MKNLMFLLKNNNFTYFFYYCLKSKWSKLYGDAIYFKKLGYGSLIKLFSDMLLTSIRFGYSFHEFFYYRFPEKDRLERLSYASTAYMYEYQLANNPLATRFYLENKLIFLDKYSEFIGRDWLTITNCSLDHIESFLKNKKQVVLKNSVGGAGRNVEVIDVAAIDFNKLAEYSKKHNFDLLEEFVYQHSALMQLSPKSLNTVRLITQLNDLNQVDILGTILRLGIDQNTDNLSTGGIACPIDPATGIVIGPGVSFNITKQDYLVHPISCIKFEGFAIPFWSEILQMCKRAALLHPENRSIGWDVAVKEDGPLLIEGNHDWGARLWQMPGKIGLKHIAKKYYL